MSTSSLSKSKVVDEIIDYVSTRYCDDTELSNLLKKYLSVKEKLNKQKTRKSTRIANTYKISCEVRNFLEPLVDAEYFKLINYGGATKEILYITMEQLQTKLYQEIMRKGQL